jgi:hypothetical protein
MVAPVAFDVNLDGPVWLFASLFAASIGITGGLVFVIRAIRRAVDDD